MSDMKIQKDSIHSFYKKVIKEKIDLNEGLFNPPDFNFILALNNLIKNHPLSALDLGYGYGNYTIYTAKLGYSVDAVDQVPKEIFISRLKKDGAKFAEKISTIEENITNFYLSKKYDLVICKDVLHFLDRTSINRIIKEIIYYSNKGTLHYLTIFTDIKRQNDDGTKVEVVGEANYSTDEFKSLLHEFYSSWEKSIVVEPYREKSKIDERKYYFECDRITIIAKKT
jgi:2-polyprenyl-3-methyl-5-hydroxy-6-metoxy-1,4-benzoquinol methylase